MKLYNTIKDLCLCPSVAGREEKIRVGASRVQETVSESTLRNFLG